MKKVELALFISPILLKELSTPSMLSATELNDDKKTLLQTSIFKLLEFTAREFSGEKNVTILQFKPLENCLEQVTRSWMDSKTSITALKLAAR